MIKLIKNLLTLLSLNLLLSCLAHASDDKTKMPLMTEDPKIQKAFKDMQAQEEKIKEELKKLQEKQNESLEK